MFEELKGTALTPVKAPYNAITPVTLKQASSAEEGFKVKLPGADESVFLLVQNTNEAAKKITVKAPERGGYAACTGDLELSIEASALAVIRIESARYANNDGSIHIVPEDDTVKVELVY